MIPSADDVELAHDSVDTWVRSKLGISSILATAIDVVTVVIGGVMIGFASSTALEAIGVVLAIVGLASLSWRVMR